MSTLIVYSGAADGLIASMDGDDEPSEYGGYAGDYDKVLAGTGHDLIAGDTSTIAGIGHWGNSEAEYFLTYWIDVAYLAFDTSDLAGKDISSAILTVTPYAEEYNGPSPTFQARLHDWGASLTPSDWLTWTQISSKTLLAHYPFTSGWTPLSPVSFVDDAFVANVVKDGTTRLVIVIDQQPNTPSTGNYGSICSGDYSGTTYDPKLTIEYTGGGAPAGLASGTGASYATVPSVAAGAGNAAATGAAYTPVAVPGIAATAGLGASTGAGYGAIPLVLLPGGLASGVGAAHAPPITPVWTYPAKGDPFDATPVLRFKIPALASAQHFHIQLDLADTFDTGDLLTWQSDLSQTDWDYWDGDSWEAVPVGGVDVAYIGNEARLTIGTPLGAGTWYCRVRAGT